MVFLNYGLLYPFCFPLGILSLFLALGFLGFFPNFVFPWTFTNFIGLPRPNYFILIFGVYGSAINPLLSLLALLWAYHGSFLLFFHIIHCSWFCYLLFLSFPALSSPFAFLKPIYLFHGLVIHYFCRLDLMVFVLNLLPTSFRPVLLGWASSLSFGFYKKDPQQKSYCWRRKWENFYDEIQFEINLEISMAVSKFENNCMRFKYKTK